MARVIQTADITTPFMVELTTDQKLWIYNGLDSPLTREVSDQLRPLLAADPNAQLIYKFERALQAPALEMMMRGIKIDPFEKDGLLKESSAELIRIENHLNAMAKALGQFGLNARSPKQLIRFFYEVLDLPEVTAYSNGTWRPTTNRQALEKLSDYLIAKPFIHAILAIRDLGQQLAVLRTGIRDGRIYTSLNQGKETGRWSSSPSAFGDGRNLQNIMDSLRTIFVPDEGLRLGYSDLKQVESNIIAYLSGDEDYIAAHLSGDVHTAVAEMVWPGVKDVNQLYYRHWTYRDLSKRAGHATNYMISVNALAKALKIPPALALEFQRLYFGRFPKIRELQAFIARTIQVDGCLISPLGRKRQFFGRLDDEATIREAVAHCAQGLAADILSYGMYWVWKRLRGKGVQLLLPVHDALLYQYSIGEDHLVTAVEKEMCFPVSITDQYGITRLTQIGVDSKVGYNWRPHTKERPNTFGMMKFGSKEANAQRPPKNTGLLDRVLS